MNPDGKGILGHLEATDFEITRAWTHAISAALRDHQRHRVPVAIWDDENHSVKLISPEEALKALDESEIPGSRTPGRN